LKEQISAKDETVTATDELRVRLRAIERQYRLVRRAIDGLPHPQAFAEVPDDLRSDLAIAKQENDLLRNQVKQLQLQIENQQAVNSQKDQRADNQGSKLRDMREKISELIKNDARLQHEIAELRPLYKEASEHVGRLAEAQTALEKKLRRAEKDKRRLTDEAEELKKLLERANEERKRQMDDNGVLLRRLRQYDRKPAEERSAEIEDLKAQLQSALALIDQLQNEIADFKRRPDAAVDSHESDRHQGKKARRVRHAHFTSEDDDGFPTKLDAVIRDLELTIHQSRKEYGLSNSPSAEQN
jgi:DNA repair exonuclease SbcCD ATPase subunit